MELKITQLFANNFLECLLESCNCILTRYDVQYIVVTRVSVVI